MAKPHAEDDTPGRVVAFAGSLRRGSYNRRLLEAAIQLAPSELEIVRFDLARIPLYNGDVEAAGDPPGVARLKRAIRAADGVLIVTPEYNRGLPAVTKNAIDWASRPPTDPPLRGKPVAVMGVTTGRGAVQSALVSARDALEFTDAIVVGPSLGLSRAPGLFNADGELADDAARREVRIHLERLRDAIRAARDTASAAA